MDNLKNNKGFTLIELLVVIAIIALLLSILLPSLGMAKEIARGVTCSTNLKSFGTGLHMYSQDYKDKAVPNARFEGTEFTNGINSGNYKPWFSYVIGTDSADPQLLKAINHGKLYGLQYLDEADIYYCPTAKLSLKSVGIKYTRNYYFENISKTMPPHISSGWGGPVGDLRCRSSYLYWTWEKTVLADLSNKPVVFDSLVRIAHMKRSKPYGINALFGDGHVNTTLVSNSTQLLDYVNQATWDDRAEDYDGFVEALRNLRP